MNSEDKKENQFSVVTEGKQMLIAIVTPRELGMREPVSVLCDIEEFEEKITHNGFGPVPNFRVVIPAFLYQHYHNTDGVWSRRPLFLWVNPEENDNRKWYRFAERGIKELPPHEDMERMIEEGMLTEDCEISLDSPWMFKVKK